jgi:hypothetical protein
MAYRALSVLTAAATVVATVYTVAGYYAPKEAVRLAEVAPNAGSSAPSGQTGGPPASEARPASPNSGVIIGPGGHITQTSQAPYSSNVIGSGNNITIGK